MAITQISSKAPGVGPQRDRLAQQTRATSGDPLDVLVPIDGDADSSTEEHRFEIAPENANDVVISVALQIKRNHSGGDSAAYPATSAASSSAQRTEGRVTMNADSTASYGGYRARASEQFLADLDLFFSRNPMWKAIALLKAGGHDPRALLRVKGGENYRIGTLDEIAETMNKAERGEIDPAKFRNVNRTKRKQAGAQAEDNSSSPEDQPNVGKHRRNIDVS